MNRQREPSFTTAGARATRRAIAECEIAAMCRGDLTREREPDAGAARLGGIEWNEQVGRIREPGSLVTHPDNQLSVMLLPPDLNRAASFERRIDSVPHQVDQQLVELPSIGVDGHVGPAADCDGTSRLERNYAPHPVRHHHRFEPGWR